MESSARSETCILFISLFISFCHSHPESSLNLDLFLRWDYTSNVCSLLFSLKSGNCLSIIQFKSRSFLKASQHHEKVSETWRCSWYLIGLRDSRRGLLGCTITKYSCLSMIPTILWPQTTILLRFMSGSGLLTKNTHPIKPIQGKFKTKIKLRGQRLTKAAFTTT